MNIHALMGDGGISRGSQGQAENQISSISIFQMHLFAEKYVAHILLDLQLRKLLFLFSLYFYILT